VGVLRLRVCGGLEVEADGRTLPDALVGGRQGRLVLAYLACERPRAVRREELAELLWADRLPDSWSASLSAVISRLRRLLSEAGLDGVAAIVSTAGSYQLVLPTDAAVDLEELGAAVAAAEAAALAHDGARAADAARTAEEIGGRGFLTDDCAWVDRQREAVRDLRVRAALALAEAHLGSGAAARAVDAARDALALDETREAAYRQLMRALAAAGERGEALRVWERCRVALVDELGVDPSPETEAVYLQVLGAPASATPAAPPTALPSGVVTFLLTDIVDSSALWDKAPEAMAQALERHDAIVAEVVSGSGGLLLKSKLEGDATVSVFTRASDGAAAALALQDAIAGEPWPEGAEPRLRMAMHTGEAFERGGDYFGPALNRAARLRALAGAGDVLLSQAVTELVRDHLPADALLRDLGHRELRGLSRGENVYALSRRTSAAGQGGEDAPSEGPGALVPPPLPASLSSSAPFVGRGDELSTLVELWDRASGGTTGAAFIGGEPGVGKSRLAGEIAAHAHAAGALVLYGRCDEDLAAPLQPFIEALRTLVPALGASRVGSVRGVDELARVVPELAELLPDRAAAVRADPDTERLALFDAVTNLAASASREAPVLLVLDDLHWAGKTTLSLLRHVLRAAKGARLLVVGTYRDTELARTHPLAETLADLRRDDAATRISLGGLGAAEIDAYLSALGIDDRALGRELTEVTSGNPFFLIEVLRHVEETGGTWSPGNLPEGVREATGRRLSRLSDATNGALSVAAVVGASFDLALVEQMQGRDLVDEIAEACQAGIVAEEPGSIDRFRFAHALVRQVLLAELVTVKRVRLHKTIAELLEAAPIGDPDARLADLAYHWSECASLGDAAKAVDACRRAADRAMERLAYEEAGDLYGMALQVVDDGDDPGGETSAGLHLARCDALLTAGDVVGARVAIDALEGVAHGSERLAAWYTTYEGLLAVLAEPDRLTEIVQSVGAAASAMRAIGDLRGEARAHYVHASALERLGQIGAAERALDAALAAARTAGDRRLADSILAEAPPAALWGPSSVTRASGRCLDVVRVLRINDGAPAVESVALRCQAVLEALRGRTDAARKMIASARRTVERLGLAHRQLETEVMAGFIELLAGEPTEAEVLLRRAYEGLRERGLGGEAAQAAAFLGRALLLQDRVDEADEVAAEAEALAGSDLKAAIAWRGVRAEAAARRGDSAGALSLAREAVDLAAATDALLLVVDARVALATVLRATGDHDAADAEARRALETCDAKGATALAARARGSAPEATGVRASAPADDTARFRQPTPPCAAMDALVLWCERFNRGAHEEIQATHSPRLRGADHRWLLADEFGEGEGEGDEDRYAANLILAYEGGSRFDSPQLLVARERAALARCDVRAPGAEWAFLLVFGVDLKGRVAHFVMFDVDDRNAANVELDRLTPDELELDNLAWRTSRQFAVATNAKDEDATLAMLAPGYQQIDLRTGMAAMDMRDQRDPLRTIFTLDDWAREDSLLELDGDRRALLQDVIWFRDGVVSDAEVECLIVVEVDDAGLILRQTSFNVDDPEAARAELRTGGGVRSTSAWRSLQRFADAINAHDWDGFTDSVSSGWELLDRRRGVTAPDGTDPLEDNYRVLFSLDDFAITITPIEAQGDRRILARYVTWFRDGDASESEVDSLSVIEIDDDERIAWQMTFAPDDLEVARTELHRVAGSVGAEG
jgi:DNA-binding SARP family transcriptional activator